MQNIEHRTQTCHVDALALTPLVDHCAMYWLLVMYGDMLGIRLPVDFMNFYQIVQSTSSTESYSEGFTLIASILHKIVSNAVSEWT